MLNVQLNIVGKTKCASRMPRTSLAEFFSILLECGAPHRYAVHG